MTKKVKGWTRNPDRDKIPGGKGQFNIDYGCIRGSNIIKNKSFPLIASKECYNCYLLVTDEFRQHVFIFCLQINYPPLIQLRYFSFLMI